MLSFEQPPVPHSDPAILFAGSSVNSFQFVPSLSVTVLLCDVVCICTTFIILDITLCYYWTFLCFSGRNVCLNPLFVLCIHACSCVFELYTCRMTYVWKTHLAVLPQESSTLFYEAGSLPNLELAKYDQQALGICLTSAEIASVCHCALLFLHWFLVVAGGNQAQIPMLTKQQCCSLSHPPCL